MTPNERKLLLQLARRAACAEGLWSHLGMGLCGLINDVEREASNQTGQTPLNDQIIEIHPGAIEYSLKPRSIPCSERMPEFAQVVLFSEDGHVHPGSCINGKWRSMPGWDFGTVTHWMPLPDPPGKPEPAKDGTITLHLMSGEPCTLDKHDIVRVSVYDWRQPTIHLTTTKGKTVIVRESFDEVMKLWKGKP